MTTTLPGGDDGLRYVGLSGEPVDGAEQLRLLNDRSRILFRNDVRVPAVGDAPAEGYLVSTILKPGVLWREDQSGEPAFESLVQDGRNRVLTFDYPSRAEADAGHSAILEMIMDGAMVSLMDEWERARTSLRRAAGPEHERPPVPMASGGRTP